MNNVGLLSVQPELNIIEILQEKKGKEKKLLIEEKAGHSMQYTTKGGKGKMMSNEFQKDKFKAFEKENDIKIKKNLPDS